jgi:hypothetical protein
LMLKEGEEERLVDLDLPVWWNVVKRGGPVESC